MAQVTVDDTRALILIVGGYGVFGARLARLLLRESSIRVGIAGRSLAAANAFCAEHGGEPFELNREADATPVLQRLRPIVVVDAAGPFQPNLLAPGTDPYALARAALSCGAHYLDLSDDAAFTAGIAALETEARIAGRFALSGASTVPAISSAAVLALAPGLDPIELIESVVLPGNRAPRGLAVMRSILSQVGHPLAQWRGGAWVRTPAWGSLQRDTLAVAGHDPLPARWSSEIGAPDLTLFPSRFDARSVTFRAGLELPLLHIGLWLLGWLVRLRAVGTLAPWAVALRWMADRFATLGSDRGGMHTRVVGRLPNGVAVERKWTLIAEQGEGPFVPAIPAFALIRRLLRGDAPAPGARPCVGDLRLEDVEAAVSTLPIHVARTDATAPPLYERILDPDAWQRLPPAVRELHDLHDRAVFAGEAKIETGGHPLAWAARLLMRFPPAAERTPVTVTLERSGSSERWTRQFGRHRFSSVLSQAPAGSDADAVERFGPMAFGVRLPTDTTGLAMPVTQGRVLGVPLPRWLTPRSDAREWQDEQGRFNFDVAIALPFVGPVIRYTGWLVRRRADADALPGSGRR